VTAVTVAVVADALALSGPADLEEIGLPLAAAAIIAAHFGNAVPFNDLDQRFRRRAFGRRGQAEPEPAEPEPALEPAPVREQQIGGSEGSLEPPGPLLEPPGPLLTHLHTVYTVF
jgi:hypothetical protein